ncbi:MAG: dockerin type I repeat-containing protein, partial [Eubacteriales bacterium]
RSGSSTIINQSNRFIYGLAPGITGAVFRDNYIQISGNGKTVYTPSATALGTGVKVELVDCTTNIVLDTYCILIFGDVNGDGNIDSIDAGLLVDIENKVIAWSKTLDAAYYLAGDLNNDGNIDSLDAGIAVDFENSVRNVNQQTGLAY